MVKYIVKANDDGISYCRCASAIAAPTLQLDCPWCGCGWMIGCVECRKCFVYARVAEVEGSYAELTRGDFEAGGYSFTEQDVIDDALWRERMLAPLKIGQIVVCLDGRFLPVDTTGVEFGGQYAQHRLDRLPHAIELEQPGALRTILGDPEYWITRELPDRED